MRALIITAFALALSLAGAQGAQGARLSGTAEALFGVAVDATIPTAAVELALTLDGEVGSGLFPDASYSATVVSGYDAATGEMGLALDEALVTVYLGSVELSAGQQRRTWGSTDGVNPVDVLNPSDLTFPPDARKLAVPMLHAAAYADDVTVELALLPVFVPAQRPDARWSQPRLPEPPPGASLVGVLPPEEHLPGAELGNVQFGVRTTIDLQAADVSATYFRGFKSQPTLSARLEPTAAPGEFQVQPVLDYDRVHVLGLDFSTAIGAVVLRGETAYTITDDPAGTDPRIGNHSVQAVLGGEYLVPGGPRTVVQAIIDHTAPDQGAETEVALKVMTALHYQPGARTNVELGWVQSLDGSGLVMPRLSYAFADGVTGEAKAYIFYGGDGSEFGDWRDNSQLRLGLAYAF